MLVRFVPARQLEAEAQELARFRRLRKLMGLCPECASPEPSEHHECPPAHVAQCMIQIVTEVRGR